MPLSPTDIALAVRRVLREARNNGKSRPSCLTAFQILNRLGRRTRSQLEREGTRGGRNAGTTYAAPSVVSRAARLLPDVQVEYLDVEGLEFHVDDSTLVKKSMRVYGIFRLKTPAEMRSSRGRP
jgi:hypothetical protein